jgi:hypothetical protein
MQTFGVFFCSTRAENLRDSYSRGCPDARTTVHNGCLYINTDVCTITQMPTLLRCGRFGNFLIFPSSPRCVAPRILGIRGRVTPNVLGFSAHLNSRAQVRAAVGARCLLGLRLNDYQLHLMQASFLSTFRTRVSHKVV